MCRNIRKLFNFEPHATNDEVHAAALQFVRKISGMNKPSQANEVAFNHAVDEIAHVAGHLMEDLVTTGAPRDREIEAEKAHQRALKRFGKKN